MVNSLQQLIFVYWGIDERATGGAWKVVVTLTSWTGPEMDEVF